MKLLIFLTFIIFCICTYRGWRALLLGQNGYRWRRNAGTYCLLGAMAGIVCAFFVDQSAFSLGTLSTLGITIVLMMVSALTLGVSILVGIARTKLSFWIIHGRWPTDEEWRHHLES